MSYINYNILNTKYVVLRIAINAEGNLIIYNYYYLGKRVLGVSIYSISNPYGNWNSYFSVEVDNYER